MQRRNIDGAQGGRLRSWGRDELMALARGGRRDARGMMLLETIVVVTVFAMVGTAVMMGLNTTYATGTNTQSQSTAENLARNQMEYIFAQAYSAPGDADYAVITPPVGYDVTAAHDYVDPLNPDPDIEKITVTISRDSVDILVLETYRFAD